MRRFALAIVFATAALSLVWGIGLGRTSTTGTVVPPASAGLSALVRAYHGDAARGVLPQEEWIRTFEGRLDPLPADTSADEVRSCRTILLRLYNMADRRADALELAQRLLASSEEERQALLWLGECVEIVYKAMLLGEPIADLGQWLHAFHERALPLLAEQASLDSDLQCKLLKAVVLCRYLDVTATDVAPTAREYVEACIQAYDADRLHCRVLTREQLLGSAFFLGVRSGAPQWAQGFLPELVESFEARDLLPARALKLICRTLERWDSFYVAVGEWTVSRTDEAEPFAALALEAAMATNARDTEFYERACRRVLDAAVAGWEEVPEKSRREELLLTAAGGLCGFYLSQGHREEASAVVDYAAGSGLLSEKQLEWLEDQLVRGE